ncbi:thiamine pyrophosphate-dependent dehydrogenase E1 component subunit alpha [Paenibacillus turpanensis]|uniref:thiamine pyrophosphate-dependent dehydrogenase E1 component subunit alpha n=1 Tax=Paenibacillus turpanensis TaxID=2689078 RepID=UPI00140C9E47|nr:thiamine pyrophosphate-dependent dehydrogenase E1 component subunit alpha [Paenibacillus turpanensis]
MAYETSAALNARHRQLGLQDEDVRQAYRMMLTARKYDERCFLLQRAGKIQFHVPGIGQEAAQVGAAFALDRESDYFFPYYRDYAFVLSAGMTVKDLLLSAFAKPEDPNSGGRQMPAHFSSRHLRIITGSSPVTTQLPHAVGFALAAKMKRKPFVSFVTFGEGSSNQGDFHEGCNFAGVHKLPVIFMCENNQYAISVPLDKQVAGNVVDRAIGYGFPGVRVDGNDFFDVYEAVKAARERGLAGDGPTLIEAVMYRIHPHSTADDDMLYRTKEEVEENKKRDGVLRLKTYMLEQGIWSEEEDTALHEAITRELQEATQYAERAPQPQPEDALLHVYALDENDRPNAMNPNPSRRGANA